MWTNPWIPRDFSRRPIALRGPNLLTDVAELIDPITGGWDVQLVQDVFWKEDADIILVLPVHEGRDNNWRGILMT